jgi:hypothetical protein
MLTIIHQHHHHRHHHRKKKNQGEKKDVDVVATTIAKENKNRIRISRLLLFYSDHMNQGGLYDICLSLFYSFFYRCLLPVDGDMNQNNLNVSYKEYCMICLFFYRCLLLVEGNMNQNNLNVSYKEYYMICLFL